MCVGGGGGGGWGGGVDCGGGVDEGGVDTGEVDGGEVDVGEVDGGEDDVYDEGWKCLQHGPIQYLWFCCSSAVLSIEHFTCNHSWHFDG